MKIELEEGDVGKVTDRIVAESLYQVRTSMQTMLQSLVKREVGKLYAETVKEQVAAVVKEVFVELNFKEMIRKRLLEEPDPTDFRRRPPMTKWIEEEAYKLAQNILRSEMTMQTQAFQKQLGERISVALTRDILKSALDEADKVDGAA